MSSLPNGTVTFLFTDIEGSTKRWEQYPQAMQAALARHDEIVRTAIKAEDGYIFKTIGDAFCAAFSTPHSALAAILNLQSTLSTEEWPPEIGSVKVRAALHTGVTEERDGDYFGQPVNRVARLLSAGHGGQVLLSDPSHDLVRDSLPSGVQLVDLGEHRLKDLIRPERIFQVTSPYLLSEFPPLKTLDNRPNNLPVQPTPLIGREKEAADAISLLVKPEVRLVTLTGPGGTGKTRLSLQVAADVLDSFPDGVWFVELAALNDHRLVVTTIASTLRVKEIGGTPHIDTVKEYLKEKKLLLVLDNFEQVAAAATEVSQLLSAGTGVKVLVTSRIPLRIRGEHEYAVPPLSLPDTRPDHLLTFHKLTQYGAVRLFIERATAARADFAVTDENAPTIAEICVRLDGLPLAIELAAARIKFFPPRAMLTRLDNRLRFLTSGALDLPARQQTLHSTIEWSYNLLDQTKKSLFQRLAVFRGGCSIKAVESVCNIDGDLGSEVAEGLLSLTDNSLAGLKEGHDEEPRFVMLQTIHEYAQERLEESGQAENLRRQHAAYYLALAGQAEPGLLGPEQDMWYKRLWEERDNLRAALHWANSNGEVETALLLGSALWRFWQFYALSHEGLQWLETALESSDGVPAPMRAQAFRAAGNLASSNDDRERAMFLTRQSLTLYREIGDKAGIAAALNNLSNATSDYVQAKALLEESLAIWRELKDTHGIAIALHNLGRLLLHESPYAAARLTFEESLSIWKQLGNKQKVGEELHQLGVIDLYQANYDEARLQFEQALSTFQGLGSVLQVAGCLLSLGCVACYEGDYSRARSLIEQALAKFRDSNDRFEIARALNYLGEVAMWRGDCATTQSLCEQALSMLKELKHTGASTQALNNLGRVAYYRGEYRQAAILFRESLELLRDMRAKRQIAIPLAALAEVAAEQDQPLRAVRLFSAAEAMLAAVGARFDQPHETQVKRKKADARAQLGESEWHVAWQEGQAMSMEQAIEYALQESN